MMARTKREHFVAQSYLRRFADPEGKLWGFNKPDRRIFRSHPINLAQEAYFYDLPATGSERADPQVVEKILAQTIDADFVRVIEGLLEPVWKVGMLDPAMMEPMSRFVTAQLLRTRYHREYQKDVFRGIRKVARAQYESLRLLMPDLPEFEDSNWHMNEDNAKAHQIASMFDSTTVLRIAAILLDRYYWTIGQTSADRPLYTSDTPVVLNPNGTGPGSSGLEARGMQLFLPLGAHQVLLLSERSYFRNCMGRDHCRVKNLRDAKVACCNTVQVLVSRRQVYCSQNSFALAETVCRQNPECGDPDRPTVEVRAMF